MICPSCAEAADFEAQLVRANAWVDATGHMPEICRDHAIQSGGCACQHRPVNPKETP